MKNISIKSKVFGLFLFIFFAITPFYAEAQNADNLPPLPPLPDVPTTPTQPAAPAQTTNTPVTSNNSFVTSPDLISNLFFGSMAPVPDYSQQTQSDSNGFQPIHYEPGTINYNLTPEQVQALQNSSLSLDGSGNTSGSTGGSNPSGGTGSTPSSPTTGGSGGTGATPTAAQIQQMQQAQNSHQYDGTSAGVSTSALTGTFPDRICDADGNCKYKLLAPIGGFLGENGFYILKRGDTKSLCALLNSWFRIGIALAGLLAVVMIVIGGIQYATTDAMTDKSGGKEKIMNALWGLLLALTTYLILNTINPALTNCEINAKPVVLDNLSINSTVAGSALQVSGYGLAGLGFTGLAQLGSGYYVGQGAVPIDTAPDGGTVVTHQGVRLDSDGIAAPSYYDKTRAWETSYRPNGTSLNALTDAYVVSPMDSSGRAIVPMGTPVLVQDLTTNKQIWAVVGDAGPAANGYGEMSVYAAKQLGAADGTSDSAANHNIKMTFYKK